MRETVQLDVLTLTAPAHVIAMIVCHVIKQTEAARPQDVNQAGEAILATQNVRTVYLARTAGLSVTV